MTVTVMADDEVVETIAAGRAVLDAPTVEFVSKGSFGRSVETAAHDATGRNVETGELKLGVSMRRRNNGMTRIGADLWRLPCDLNARAIELLQNYWRLLNEATPMKTQTRMEQHFGHTFFQFDTLPEQVSGWREILKATLSDASSYVNAGNPMPRQTGPRIDPVPKVHRRMQLQW